MRCRSNAGFALSALRESAWFTQGAPAAESEPPWLCGPKESPGPRRAVRAAEILHIVASPTRQGFDPMRGSFFLGWGYVAGPSGRFQEGS